MRQTTFYTCICTLLMISFFSCTKHEPGRQDEKSITSYPNTVLDKWIALQVRLMRDAVGVPNNLFARPFAYSGITAYESISQGVSDDEQWPNIHWNGLSGLPQANKWQKYFWLESLNSAMAAINHKFFPKATPADSAAIDSLESAIQASFVVNPETLQRSKTFGASIADAIFSWAETDGYKHASDPYTPPVGPGLWTPTPPAFAAAASPYWGNNRPTVAGSTDHTQPGPPPFAYSTDPGSNFFKMVQQVYTASQNLTPEQTAMALWWRDIPGVSSPGHWVSILHQLLQQTNVKLGKAALAYALSGTSLYDASMSCWQTKYKYNQVRPITYIRGVMGFTTWNSLLTTPAHPEYPSAHAVISAAAAAALNNVLGNVGSFTDHTYDYLGWAPRTFPSLKAIAIDAGNSRLYAGIHYQPSIDTGLIQGKKVAANIFNSIYHHNPSKSDN